MSRQALYLLGPPRIELDGEPIHIGRTKAVALLAYLAVTGKPHRRDALAALLWRDFDQSGARAELRRALSVLNRALGKGWRRTDRDTVGMIPDAQTYLDVNEFRQLLTACERHDHPSDEDCADCLSRLTDAVALYHDDFLAGFTLPDAPEFDEWQRLRTQNLRDGLGSALERLSECLGAQIEHDAAIAYARRWLDLDPTHEPAHRRLMGLYAQAGRRGAALRQYRRCVRTLEHELDVPPSAETTVLYERLRAESEIAAPGPVPQAVRPRQLPAFLTLEAAPAAVREPIFVARERELARLTEYLEASLAGQGRVTFIFGGPGRGKTALMRAFSRRAMDAHPELLVASGSCTAYSGVGDPYLPFREIMDILTGDVEARWLAGVISAEHARRLWAALPDTARALLNYGPYLIDALVPGPALLGRATAAVSDRPEWLEQLRGRVEREKTDHAGLEQSALFHQSTNVLCTLAESHPLVLTLDDLQWVDAGSAGLLFHLGRRLADTRARVLIVGAFRPEEVVTARDGQSHPLEKTLTEFQRQLGDVWIDLSRASETEGRRFVETLLDSEPNRLGKSFREELIRRTGGHALFTVELLRAMQERGDLFQDSGGRWTEGQALDWETLPARVEAVIKARVEPLEEELREILTVASVEGEGFTAQVVARVLDIPERQVLQTLSRELGPQGCRLVRAAEEVQVDGRFVSHYRFAHALFQAYLYQALSVGERRLLHGEVGVALEEVYVDRSEEVVVQLAHHYAMAGQLEKAVEYSLRAGDQARRAYANEEAIRYYQQTLALLRGSALYTSRKDWRLAALRGLGRVHYAVTQPLEAEKYLREAISIGKETGLATRDLVRLYYWLAEALFYQNRIDEPISIGEEGLELLGADVESVEGALMYDLVTSGYWLRGDSERAREFSYPTAGFLQRLPYAEAVTIAEDLIVWYSEDKEVEEAMKWVRFYERRERAHHSPKGLAMAHSVAGWHYAQKGDVLGGISQLQQSVELCTRIGDTTQRVWSLVQLGPLFLSLGDLQLAEQYASAEQALGIHMLTTWTHRCSGQICLARGAWEQAVEAFQNAYQLGREVDDHWERAWSARHLGRAYLAGQDVREAIKRFQETLNLAAPETVQGRFGPLYIASVGPESVRQNAHLFVSALGGLEEAYQALGDPEAYRAVCERLHAEYPGFRDLALVNWYAEPAVPRDFAQDLVYETFVETLSDDWMWQDPFDDCSYVVKNRLEIRAANGRDLVHINLSAPRLLRQAPKGEDFAVETVCGPVSGEGPAIGGLMLWKDEQNYLRLDRGCRGNCELSFQGCFKNKDAIVGRGRLPSDRVFLRLERVGERVRALCSADGEAWFSVGKVEFPIDDELQVGLHAIGSIDRTIYHGAYPCGTAIRFESFTLWKLTAEAAEDASAQSTSVSTIS